MTFLRPCEKCCELRDKQIGLRLLIKEAEDKKRYAMKKVLVLKWQEIVLEERNHLKGELGKL